MIRLGHHRRHTILGMLNRLRTALKEADQIAVAMQCQAFDDDLAYAGNARFIRIHATKALRWSRYIQRLAQEQQKGGPTQRNS